MATIAGRHQPRSTDALLATSPAAVAPYGARRLGHRDRRARAHRVHERLRHRPSCRRRAQRAGGRGGDGAQRPHVQHRVQRGQVHGRRDRGHRRGRRGGPRVVQPSSRDRREDRLSLLQPRSPAAVEVPHPRAFWRRRPLCADRGPAGLRGRDVQHASRLREVRTEALPRRDAPGGRARLGGRGADPLDRGADPEHAGPARGGLPGLPHRRPQPALEPGLHRGDRRHAEGRHGGDPVAGQRDAARRRHARHVPRDPPRPGREPRSHPRQPRLQGGRLRRPDRLPVRRRPGGHADQRARRRGRRTERRPRVRALDVRPPRRAVDVRGDPGRAAPDALARTPAAHRGRGARRPLPRAGKQQEHRLDPPRGRVGGRGDHVGDRHRRVRHHLVRHRAPRPGRLRHHPGGRRRHRARAQLLLGAFGEGGRDAVDRQPDVRRR